MKKDSLPQLFRAILWLSLLPFTGTLRGQTLFSENFDANTFAQWIVFNGSGDGTPDFTVQFAFDYSTNRYVANGVTNLARAGSNSSRHWRHSDWCCITRRARQ